MIPLRDVIPTRTWPGVTIALIVVNVVVFLHEQMLGRHALELFVRAYGLVPADFAWDRVVTSMFLHGGWAHIGGNMLYLWIFGDNVEDRLGHVRYLVFYLLCGAAAALAQTFVRPDSSIPMIGASGAISGVLGAYLVLFPHSRVLTIVPIVFIIQLLEVPAIVLLGLWFLMQLLSGVGSLGARADVGGVAFWAHVAGFVAGLALVNVLKQPERQKVEWWDGVRALIVAGFVAATIGVGLAQTKPRPAANPGRVAFERTCARCHGADGRGGEMGPGILSRLAMKTDADLSALVRSGLPEKGMPGTALPDAELRALVAHARGLRPGRGDAVPRVDVPLAGGGTASGIALNRSAADLQLLAGDGRLQLLRRSGETWRRVTSQADWPTYHGDPRGNRYSPLDHINRTTVGRLAPAWVFTLPGAGSLQVTPVVVDGVMYVTNANECVALDAGSGRRIWHYQRPRTKGLAGDAASGINRGVAVDGDRVFMVTDHAHLIALNRFTGDLVWETTMADWRQNYGATSAPLVVGNLVVSGISGGDEGVRGFLAAYDRRSGREVWRFWTVPARGEPGSETWRGTAPLEHGCAATWLTGTYDADLQTLYWPTGNPCPDYDGAGRQGDNLYSDSILALDPATGRLKWHFQYTPHDLWDWDAQQPPVLVDLTWDGAPRKLLLHANRNGFFYVLDRTDGALLLAKPFVKKLTWAQAIDAKGRPILNPDQTPTAEGRTVCPAVEGATNWFSTAFAPSTGLYYVQALEKCTIFARSPETWRAGQSFYGGTTRRAAEPGQKVLRAIDVRTGAIAWEMPQTGPGSTWGGTLATAGGLVFLGEDSGALMAVDAATGAPVWQFQTNVQWKASPMTYAFDGRQHVAVAAGPNILAFKLID